MSQYRTAFRSLFIAGFLAVGLSACNTMGNSNMVVTKTQMNASHEVPPNSSSGTGMIETTFDKSTNMLSWKLHYSGLTGPAVAAHFHGPAAMGANSGVVVPFQNPISDGLEGHATLTAAQAADFLAGKWYANVHTAANKGGEIRGQVMPGM
ncbi:MAG TPA: CHRD domain-containing protein [Burkholderiales bacterium]|nr:CHRD domain-containing protein [Burkholderiales bacterium]